MFTATSTRGPNRPNQPHALPGLNGLPTRGTLATLPAAFSAGFGRVARRYPAPALAGGSLAGARALPPPGRIGGTGWKATLARLAAKGLARMAEAAERRSQQWCIERDRRITEHALRQLDPHTLRDIGLIAGEISSIAREASGEIEASRARIWRGIGIS